MHYHRKELVRRIGKIGRVFDIDKVLSVNTDAKGVSEYYRKNKLAYTLFHNRDGFIHMGISRDGKLKKKDLLEPAKTVEKYIKVLSAKRVLELATGRGANSVYLAERHPSAAFEGIDLPDGQLDYAMKKAAGLKNFHPRKGDFHDLRRYPAGHFDIVFIVEALCHSTKKKKVVEEVKRVLKKGGLFIVIDGYANADEQKLAPEEKLGKKLIERGMRVPNFENFDSFKKQALQAGFKIAYEEDVTKFIIPTLKKFERMSAKVLDAPLFVAKMFVKLFPAEFTYNVISGYLMQTFVLADLAKYTILVLRKK